MRRALALLLVALATLIALPAAAKPLRVLYLDQSVGWKHAPVARPEGGGPSSSDLAPSETAMIAIGQEVAGRDDRAILARLSKMDPVWQAAAAARIADLRTVYPKKPDSDRAPFETAYRAVLADVLARGGVR